MNHNISSKRIGEAMQLGQELLSPFSDTPWLDIQVLLAHITGLSRTRMLAHPEIPLSSQQAKRLARAFKQLKEGVPLPYVVGEWEFFGHNFLINPSVLIPRPETEILVERALHWLQAQPEKRMAADTGTGSGCIAISLAVDIPGLQVIATDISTQALKLAQANAIRHRVTSQVTFTHGDLLEPLKAPSSSPVARFDLMVANLPYIPSGTLKTLQVFGHEPTQALDGGKDGLDLIRRYLVNAPHFLAPGGLILLEIEASQGKSAIKLSQSHFPKAMVRLHPDLGGHDRLLQIQT